MLLLSCHIIQTIFLSFFFLLIENFLPGSEEDEVVRRIQAHLVIGDSRFAVVEAEQGLSQYPHSVPLMIAYIRTLARQGDERTMLKAWHELVVHDPDQLLNREIIEEMGWGVLHKASQSSSLVMRPMALLAAFFSQDAKGVEILKQAMRDQNYGIRALAVKLASNLRDDKLIDEVVRLFKEENIWGVRQQVLEAVGKMKIIRLKDEIESLIASQESLQGETALAIAAFLQMVKGIDSLDIERLSSSCRSGLRQLACKAIAHFQSKASLDHLIKLAKDPHPDVRFASLNAIGQLRPLDTNCPVLSIAREHLLDPSYRVAISAAWLLTLYEPDEGCRALIGFLHDKRQEVRMIAAGALSTTGAYGAACMEQQFQTHPDLYVRLNLALGLIGLRRSVPQAASHVRWMLLSQKEQWHLQKVGLFSAITPKLPHLTEDPLVSPEIESQLLRLELLNLLAILKYPETQQTIRDYLSERSAEISATAAALLLTEGDESAVDLVKELLRDPQPRLRLQAALILSLWSRDEEAIQVLEEGYQLSSWELKTRILEGIGRIGSIQSVPFLIRALNEPSQTLRLIAAMALIQCLNH